MSFPFLSVQEQTTTFAVAGSHTTHVYIGGAGKVGIHISTFSTAADLHIQVCNTSTTANFVPLYVDGASATSGVGPWELGATTGMLAISTYAPIGWKYMRLQVTTAASAVNSCTVVVYS